MIRTIVRLEQRKREIKKDKEIGKVFPLWFDLSSKKETGHYIRRERYSGACERSFYVGEDVKQEDIKAYFEHGMLTLFVPKKEAKPAVETDKYISIEG